METRILIVKKGCYHCRNALSVINKVNAKVPIEKRIRIFDAFEWEEFRLDNLPIMKKFEKEDFVSYPFLYLDGIVIDPFPTPEQLTIFMKNYLNSEMII